MSLHYIARCCVLLCILDACRGLSSSPLRTGEARLAMDEGRRQDSIHTDRTDASYIIHWKGEKVEGYSMQFRHYEFTGALSAVVSNGASIDSSLQACIDNITYVNALSYTGDLYMSNVKEDLFNQAMQYLHIPATHEIPEASIVKAVERCSLIHAIYKVVATGSSFEELSDTAVANNRLCDVYTGRDNSDHTWCVRVRSYGKAGGERRHGDRTRSVSLEQKALKALKPLLLNFGGNVDLKQPDCKLYIFDGLSGDDPMVLARRITRGPQTSVIAPVTRICVTNTPLEPIAAFTLCNMAQLYDNADRPCKVLDLYAGSGTILLAASMIAPTCQTVGIEIAHDGLVNRDNIRLDFTSRNLQVPMKLMKGDCTDSHVRDGARMAVGDTSFDLVITDPPYGIRESTNYNSAQPVQELFAAITYDLNRGRPLLRPGGRLVCFVPCTEDECIYDILPSDATCREAGLRLERCLKQPLNKSLSRWLVSYISLAVVD